MNAVSDARTCGLCGRPATGIAMLNLVPYCHGDADPTPTCYERAVIRMATSLQLVLKWAE